MAASPKATIGISFLPEHKYTEIAMHFILKSNAMHFILKSNVMHIDTLYPANEISNRDPANEIQGLPRNIKSLKYLLFYLFYLIDLYVILPKKSLRLVYNKRQKLIKMKYHFNILSQTTFPSPPQLVSIWKPNMPFSPTLLPLTQGNIPLPA